MKKLVPFSPPDFRSKKEESDDDITVEYASPGGTMDVSWEQLNDLFTPSIKGNIKAHIKAEASEELRKVPPIEEPNAQSVKQPNALSIEQPNALCIEKPRITLPPFVAWGKSVEMAIDLCSDEGEGDSGHVTTTDDQSVIDLCGDNDDVPEVVSWSAPSPKQRLETAVRNGDIIEL